MGGPEPVAALERVTRRFDAVVALHDVTLSFDPGAVHALVGENGSGKSTMVRILSGALRPTSGTVLVDGRPAELHSPRQAIRLGIAAAYQESALVPQLSVAENILLGHEPASLGVLRSARRQAARWLEEVGLDVSPAAPTSRLSVAEQQLVAIAKALSLDARLLILDEPTAALNQVEVEHLFTLVADLRGRGLAILYITHRLVEVERIADVLTVLKDGRLVATRPAAGVSPEAIVPLMVGREVSKLFPARDRPDEQVVLAAEDLESADGAVSVERVEVRAGEIVGIAGLEGSGRATLARLLGGVEAPRRGRVVARGRPLRRGRPSASIRRGLGFVPPDRRRQAIVPRFSVTASITQSALRALSPGGVILRRRERRAADVYIRRLGVKTAGASAPITTLSGGNQQKVVLARALCAGSRVLVCDEPTAGVDIGARGEIYAQLAQLAGEGVGVVVSSSDMLELLGLCHRTLVMREGRLTAEFPAGSATEEELLMAQLPKGVTDGPVAPARRPGIAVEEAT